MIAKLRSWWEQIQKHPVAARLSSWPQKNKHLLIIAAVIILVLLLVFALAVYEFGWDWTGFTGGYSKITKTSQGTTTEYSPGKTLWDWMQLLLIPFLLAIGGFWLNQIQKSREDKAMEHRAESEREAAEKRAQTERDLAADDQKEAILQAYLDRMSELLLERNLRASRDDDEVRNVARARTLIILPQLDAKRKQIIVQFLNESQLLRIINLSGANLSGNDLSLTDLSQIDLSGADLSDADLHGADLSGTKLSKANLKNADLICTKLIHADLSGASLVDAPLHSAELSGANLLGADLSGARLWDADLSGNDLSHTKLSGASLFRAKLSGVKLGNTISTSKDDNLKGAMLRGANLSHAVLINISLSGADLSGANLSEAHLSGVILDEANLSGADLSRAHLGPSTNLLGAKSNTLLRKADLSDANLSGADLTTTDLSGANLSGAALTTANLSNANLKGTILEDVYLKDAHPSWAGLSESDLRLREQLLKPLLNLDEAKLKNIGEEFRKLLDS